MFGCAIETTVQQLYLVGVDGVGVGGAFCQATKGHGKTNVFAREALVTLNKSLDHATHVYINLGRAAHATSYRVKEIGKVLRKRVFEAGRKRLASKFFLHRDGGLLSPYSKFLETVSDSQSM
jgi:hypothetical protein